MTNSPKAGANYFSRDTADLKEWYHHVKGLLSSGPSGAYRLCTEIFGEQGTRLLHEAGQFPSVTVPQSRKRAADAQAGPSSSRRPRLD